MASGYALIHNGAVNSTNAALKVTCGFKPRSVILKVANGAEAFWNELMGDDAAFKRTAAGAGSKVSADGITQESDGFTIGADADFNPSTSAVIYYEAKQ